MHTSSATPAASSQMMRSVRSRSPSVFGMLTFSDDELKAQIHEEVGMKPHFSMESFSDLEEDVRQSVAGIQASPFIPHKESVRGFVYEVESGRLREVR
jgi:carbonic anhydrase